MANDWRQLWQLRISEGELQRIFDNWTTGRDGYTVAGVPGWLAEITSTNRAARQRTFRVNNEYSFTPDVIWEEAPPTWVVELKSAFKYQPLGLPEVLQHVAMLGGPARPVRPDGPIPLPPLRPVLFTEYSQWTRGALIPMLESGFRRDAMKYHDFRCLSFAGPQKLPEAEVQIEHSEGYSLDDAEGVGMGPEDAHASNADIDTHAGRLLWFDDPLAPWAQVSGSPASPFLPASYTNGLTWYFVPETQTWTGTPAPLGQRPIFWTRPYVMATLLDITNPSRGTLVWQRNPSSSTPAQSITGEYYLYLRGRGTQDQPSRSF